MKKVLIILGIMLFIGCSAPVEKVRKRTGKCWTTKPYNGSIMRVLCGTKRTRSRL